jgi:tetratricopeptide (TPR) repeat protein
MAGIRHGLACVATLLCVCGGLVTTKSEARSSIVASDDAAKKAQDAARLTVGGEFQGVFELFHQGRFAEAEQRFAWIARVRKSTTWGERAQFYLAECQFLQKKYVSALESYERLHYDYPATSHLDALVSREYEIARFWLAQSDPRLPAAQKLPWTARLGGRLPLSDVRGAARRALEYVERNQPEGPLADDAAIRIADWYMERRDHATAAMYYDQFLEFYGGKKSPLRPRAWLGAVDARIRADLEMGWDVTVEAMSGLADQGLRFLSILDDHRNRGGR